MSRADYLGDIFFYLGQVIPNYVPESIQQPQQPTNSTVVQPRPPVERKDPFDFVDPNEDKNDQVVVSRKRQQSKKTRKKSLSKSRSTSASNSRGLAFTTSRTSIFSQDSPLSCTSEAFEPEEKHLAFDDENDKLTQILAAYKTCKKDNPLSVNDDGEDTASNLVRGSDKNNNDESTEGEEHQAITSNAINSPDENDKHESGPVQSASLDSPDTSEDNISSGSEVRSEETILPLTGGYFSLNFARFSQPDIATLNRKPPEKETVKHELMWIPRLTDDNLPFKMENVISISAFNDESVDGVAILVLQRTTYFIYIYPGFKKIKCPSFKCPIKSFDINCQEIFILLEDGSVYQYVEWMKCRIFGKRFTPVLMTRTRAITCLSVNKIDQLVWLVDDEGLGWVYKLRAGARRLARDDSYPPTKLTMVSVSPRNSAIVWAIDDKSTLYVREGIFNEKSDGDNLIAGINWIPVPIPGPVKHAKASHDSVWIICNSESGEEKLFKRTGVDPPFDYIGNGWEEYQLPTTTAVSTFSSISGR